MPAHAAGKVEVTVIIPTQSGAQSSVPGGYRYTVPPAGHQRVAPEHRINRRRHTDNHQRYRTGVRRDRDGRWHRESFRKRWGPDDHIYLSTPAHAAGTVEVIVTDRYGQAGSGVFTYASPATFDFNGDWQGWAGGLASRRLGALLALTIRDNIVVSVSCSVCRPGENCAIVSAPSLTLDPPPVVANGEFSFAGSGGVSITGKFLSPIYAFRVDKHGFLWQPRMVGREKVGVGLQLPQTIGHPCVGPDSTRKSDSNSAKVDVRPRL